MPVYEYFCRRCKKAFEALMHIGEHEREAAKCPSCNQADEVEKRMASVNVRTTRKSQPEAQG